MPKDQLLCDLCGKPLKNLDDFKTRHDRRCKGFAALHLRSLASTSAAQPLPSTAPPLADTPMEVDEPRPPTPPPEPPRPRGLPNRRRRQPAKLRDIAPPPPPRIHGRNRRVPSPEPPPAQEPQSEPEPTVLSWIRTPPNSFGLYKVYPRRPTHDPDALVTSRDRYNVSQHADGVPSDIPLPHEGWFYPFPNATVAHLMRYHIEEEHPESNAGFDRLIAVLQPDEERQSDGVNLADIPFPFHSKRFLDDLDRKGIEPLGVTEKWQLGKVDLPLPCVGRRQKESDAPLFTVDDIHFRPLLDPIREVLQGPLFENFHTTPFALRFDPSFNGDAVDRDVPLLGTQAIPVLPPQHEDVYSEVYNSPAMLEAYASLPQPSPPQGPDDPVESIVVAIMEWSDATHLAQFGLAHLWPGYTFFGNHPKDFRGKPSCHAGFHQIYFADLPDSIRNAYREHYDRDMPDKVFAHLKRELMHRTWDLLLSDEFMDTYDNGVKIRCRDGVVRLVFPRFLTYSADYPEKILLATIKSLGGCPCPRCFVRKAQIAETGTVNDMKRRQAIRVDDEHRRSVIESARKAIFEQGSAIDGTTIKGMLQEKSWVPVCNAFSKLDTAKTPFNLFSLFVPDLLHEVELGVGKAVVIHLVRMLHTFKNLQLFDQRFRQIEPFGASTIRRFHKVSELKFVAARTYEDIIQCILPVLEGLFPQHQDLVNRLCFELAVWHGLAKLRMHTSSTIADFRSLTKELLTTIRRFARETADVKTYETANEERKRIRAAAASAAARAASSAENINSAEPLAPSQPTAAAVGPQPKPKLRRKKDVTSANVAAAAEGAVSAAHSSSASSTAGSTGLQGPSKPSDATSPVTPASGIPAVPLLDDEANQDRSRKPKLEKRFNLISYKLHAIADYPDSIVRIGTMDSVSTQTGELAHRLAKFFYRRTNKRDHVRQIAKQEHRRRLIRAMWERRKRFKIAEARASKASTIAPMSRTGSAAESRVSTAAQKQRRLRDALRPASYANYGPYIPPEQHHYISSSTRTYCELADFPDADQWRTKDLGCDGPPISDTDAEMADVDGIDPALIDFPRKVKSYLRRWLLNRAYDGDDLVFSDEDLIHVVIEKGRLYTHATMRLNYTTYDLRRAQDAFNLRNRRFFVVHSQDTQDPHRFWYGEIIGIFHANVLLTDLPGSKFQRVEFVWVRWFQRDMRHRCGFHEKRLPRVNYMPHDNADAFGILDPQDIVRAAHLIPAFHHGRTVEYLPKSITRRASQGDQDWTYYYASMVVDRDMIMRYRDNVIGHRKLSPDVVRGNVGDIATPGGHDPAAAPTQDTEEEQEGADAIPVHTIEGEDNEEGEEDQDWCEEERSDLEEPKSDEDEDEEKLYGDAAIYNSLELEAW
uniref:Uncharacterized protein n=1 Tax=Mycena chlorophos TaxID=658473 RepID=A0ABQ0LH30_MYCCL|nr:predicted protein [Mycena chlorophos]